MKSMSAELPIVGGGVKVPHIVQWTEECDMPMVVLAGRFGVSFADETAIDRDRQGVLWTRIVSRPGVGRPIFGWDHSVRQRKAMRKLLCFVCGRSADRNGDGALWLLPDYRDDWPGWPNKLANEYPPICLPCARLSVRLCPSLRGDYVAVRAHAVVCGVIGLQYRQEPGVRIAQEVGIVTAEYGDPAIRWTVASKLVAELQNCKFVDLD